MRGATGSTKLIIAAGFLSPGAAPGYKLLVFLSPGAAPGYKLLVFFSGCCSRIQAAGFLYPGVAPGYKLLVFVSGCCSRIQFGFSLSTPETQMQHADRKSILMNIY